jgi:CBS domain-containing protein
MNSEKVGALAVVEEGKLYGIFTYRDLVDRVILEKRDPDTTKLEDVMTKEVETLRADGCYGDALRVMVEKDYTYVPILGEGDKLAGMLAARAQDRSPGERAGCGDTIPDRGWPRR